MAFTSANAQRQTQNFTELNIGLAAIDDHSFDTVVPGISLLFGRTIQFSNNNVAEVQVGAAAPTLITGKLAAGIITANPIINRTTYAGRGNGPILKEEPNHTSVVIGTRATRYPTLPIDASGSSTMNR